MCFDFLCVCCFAGHFHSDLTLTGFEPGLSRVAFLVASRGAARRNFKACGVVQMARWEMDTG